MALPVQNTPIYTLTIPSSKQEMKYRPFLVKEQKALLLAQSSENPIVMIDTLKAVISSCSKDTVNVDSLAIFDLEYIFSQIRAKSVGEYVELFFYCDEDHGSENDKAKVLFKIDLTKIEVEFSEGHTTKIDLFDDVGVMMKYPTISVIKNIEQLSGGDKNVDAVFDIIAQSIDYIYSGDEIFYAKEQSSKELQEFINNLTQEQFQKIENFFETMPKLRQKISYNCPVCGKENNKILEGLNNFF